MTRFLTPSKIGLLTLITLYHENTVPTAASIPILSFIVDHILNFSSSSSDTSHEFERVNGLISIDEFQASTIQLASIKPGRTIWDLFLDKLWELDSFDALHDFFDDLTGLLVRTQEQQAEDEENGIVRPLSGRTRLSRSSPFGLFVRRAQLEFIRMQFHDSMTLWHAFAAFRHPTLPLWAKRHPEASAASFDINLAENTLQSPGPLASVIYRANEDTALAEEKNGLVSTDDVEKLLEFQVEEMQKHGSRVPPSVKNKLQMLLEDISTPPSVLHYLKFLDSWRSGDYPSSFDHLHRYFDYTMHNRDRTFYQYALLNLAILQAEFGCYTEALAAMQETISTARENKDMSCLNFSLSWIYHFSATHPKAVAAAGDNNSLGQERDALSFLRIKAKETGMYGLWSTSLLGEAKLGLQKGESVAAVFENILRSSHLNVSKGVENMIGSQLLLQSSIWSRLGVSSLSVAYCEIFLEVHSRSSPLDDRMKITCKYASMIAGFGRHQEASALLQSIDAGSLRSLKAYQYWTVFSTMIKLKRDLFRGDLDACDYSMNLLRVQPLSDRDLCFEIRILGINLLIERRAFGQALREVQEYAKELEEQEADIYHRLMMLLLKVDVLKKAGQTEKGFSVATRAANIAWQARLLPSLWQACCAIADVMLALSEFNAVAKMVGAIMPQLLETKDAFTTGRAFSVLADAHVGMAGRAQPESTARKEHLTKALGLLDHAFDEFSKIEDLRNKCEMIAKKATLLRAVGENMLAIDCASKYLALKQQQE